MGGGIRILGFGLRETDRLPTHVIAELRAYLACGDFDAGCCTINSRRVHNAPGWPCACLSV